MPKIQPYGRKVLIRLFEGKVFNVRGLAASDHRPAGENAILQGLSEPESFYVKSFRHEVLSLRMTFSEYQLCAKNCR